MIETIVIGGLLFKGAKDISRACDISDRAESIQIKASGKISDAKMRLEEARQRTDNAVVKNFTRRKGILLTSIKSFLDLYGRIIKINFVETDEIRKLINNEFSLKKVENINFALKSPILKERTTQQIVATWFFNGLPGLMIQDSQIELNQAKIARSQANVIASQAETYCEAFNIITEKCDEMTELITKLNIMLNKSISTSEAIIDKNGYSRDNYSDSDRDVLMTCINVASAVKKLIEAPIMDEEGKLAQQMLKAIETGNLYLRELEKIIRE